MTPELTAVIIPLVGGQALVECIDAVRRQGVRAIVVGDDAPEIDGVTNISGGRQTIPQRRQAGVRTADTEIVALLEDTTIPGPSWGAAIRAGFSDPHIGAIGGPVAIADDLTTQCMALGYCEYGRFQPNCFADLSDGTRTAGGLVAVQSLPGNNFAFRRAELCTVLDSLDAGLIDGEVFDGLTRSGRMLAYHPDMTARYVQPHPQGASLATRFQHGRHFGGRRPAGRSAMARWGFVLAMPALPLVLTWRTLKQLPNDRRSRLPLLGWILVMHCAWAAGEAVGYLAGAGCHSLRRWR